MSDAAAVEEAVVEPVAPAEAAAEVKPKKPRKKPKPQPLRYGEREMQALTLLAQGLSYPDIAVVMEVGLDTVKGHMRRLYRKLGAKTGPQAVSIAIGKGLLTAEGKPEAKVEQK